jgi:hypothetical protein
MANATVEKLKVLGLRHGEKAAVGVISALCLLFIGMAWSHPTISLTPDELKKSAEAAQANINKPQKQEDILAKLDQEKLIDPGFEKVVDERSTKVVDASKFALNGAPLVSPEPGAGLIRDMPVLLAPMALYVNSSRGAALVYARDQAGEIQEEDEPDLSKRIGPKKRRRTRMGGMRSGGMGMGGMMGKTKRKKRQKSEAEKYAEQKRQNQIEQERRNLAVEAGKDEAPPDKDAEEKPKGEIAAKKLKETTQGLRVVTIVGKLDHKKLKENYVRALKDPSAAPHYIRVDLERQELSDDGVWGEFKKVDRDYNQEIINSALEKEEELTPAEVRLPGLVDDMPFFKAGYWRGVHVYDMVPKKQRSIADLPPPKKKGSGSGGYADMMRGMMGGGGMSGASGGSGGGMNDMMRGMRGGMGMEGDAAGRGGRGGSGMMGMRGLGGGMAGGSTGGGGPSDTNFAKTDSDKIMIRALDFTVEPDTTYQYRVRIVVRNPNYGWETVAPGVDTSSEEKEGPWSEPTSPVSVLADVSAYTLHLSLADKQNEDVTFQVARWNEADGLTIVQNFDATPGQVIGEKRGALVPGEPGKDLKSQNIDFTSRQILLDTPSGGERSVAAIDPRARFEAPAQALVMKSDGTLVLRDQARDAHAPEVAQVKHIYQQSIDEAKAGKKKKSGGRMGGMMGMGGSGGGGMGGATGAN